MGVQKTEGGEAEGWEEVKHGGDGLISRGGIRPQGEKDQAGEGFGLFDIKWKIPLKKSHGTLLGLENREGGGGGGWYLISPKGGGGAGVY